MVRIQWLRIEQIVLPVRECSNLSLRLGGKFSYSRCGAQRNQFRNVRVVTQGHTGKAAGVSAERTHLLALPAQNLPRSSDAGALLKRQSTRNVSDARLQRATYAPLPLARTLLQKRRGKQARHKAPGADADRSTLGSTGAERIMLVMARSASSPDGGVLTSVRVAMATDVASKGMDFPNIQHVINYDMPDDIENYVHRIGRTGRGKAVGVATTMINSKASFP